MMKSTELNLIPIFVAIYEELNLSKAANRLEISQPAVSKALSRLRDVYDDTLFHRCASGVEATTFANDIYPAMSAALKSYTSTLSASRDFDPKVSNRIFSVACVSMASYELMPKVMEIMNQAAPNIQLEIHPLFTEDYESDLRLQRHDLILDITPEHNSSLKFEAIMTESLVVAYRSNHPRMSDSITMDQFLAEDHVVASRWHARKSLLSSAHNIELGKRRIVYRAAGVMEMLPAIELSNAIGMIPKSTAQLFSSTFNIKSTPLPFELPIISLSMIWHPRRSAESSHKWLRSKVKLAAKQMFENRT